MTYYDCKFEREGKFIESAITDEPNPIPLTTQITWTLIEDSVHVSGRKREIKALKRAFLRIGQVIPIKFKFQTSTDVDIAITFSNDDNYFKNRPSALAYAFVGTMSQDIDLVYNESYFWALNREQGNNRYDLEIVAIHEILHVLGLRHSTINDSVMFPNYQGIYDMNEDDISKLQSIWGIRGMWSRRLLWLKGYFQRIL